MQTFFSHETLKQGNWGVSHLQNAEMLDQTIQHFLEDC